MADDLERTEQPTPRRRAEARARGQVPRSQDLTASALLLIALLVLHLLGADLFARLHNMTRLLLGDSDEPSLLTAQIVELSRLAGAELARLLLPILLLLLVAALIVSLLQTGFLFTTEPLKLNLNRLNPLAGLQRLFSAHSFVLLLISLAKMAVVAAVVYYAIAGDLGAILFASSLALEEMVKFGLELLFSLGVRLAVVLLFLGVLDWLYQRYKHESSLKMTKQEIREELRRMDGDPLLKRRRREVQMRLAMQRLRRDVPKADVVVTNPTHLAVALKYDSRTMTAPRVLAKGEGYVAERIRALAVEFGIPLVERKPLAQALFNLVEIGQEVPPQLYKAVAEVLAYVYEIAGRRRSMKVPVTA